MADWLALSDSTALGGGSGPVGRGLLVAEFALPLEGPTVLFAHQTQSGPDRGLSLFIDPAAGISLHQRQGKVAVQHRLACILPSLRGTGRLSFTFDAPARLWRLAFDVVGSPEHSRSIQGTGPFPFDRDDLHALAVSAPGTQRHAALLWFGVTSALTLPSRAAWIGPRSSIDTRRGAVAAADLRPGDLISTLDQGFVELRRLHHHRLPARGSFAPILLRSPFFGHSGDILVSSDQLVLISGASVEYICGVEEALVPAAALCDGKVAEKEERRAVTDSVSLELDAPGLIIADGCCLLSACDPTSATLPRRALAPFETLPLLALLGRTALRHVA